MNTIYKYPIEITDRQEIQMPFNAIVIHAGLDPKGVPCVWAEVESNKRLAPVELFIVGTGNPMPEKSTVHIGSFVQGPFVWHVFKSA